MPRANDAAKQAYNAGLLEVQQTLTRTTGSDTAAWNLTASSVGAVMLARAMPHGAEQDALLNAAKQN